MNFVNGLGTLLKPIMDDIIFSPKFVTVACEKCTFSYKQYECLSDGKYCAPDHADHDESNRGQVHGREVLLENIYQFELSAVSQYHKRFNFFKYMRFINDLCGTRITKHCHDRGFADI